MGLDVYLYGVLIGELRPAGGRDYELAYDPEPLEEFSEGAAVLSNSLPASADPYSPHASRVYVEGLLPAGAQRERVAAELGLDADDGYGLIAALGRDCPGGVTILPGDESGWEIEEDEDSIAWLSEAELEELLEPQPRRLFDPGRTERMRFALPGRRHKLSLSRTDPDEPWAWPGHYLPSTHVIKSESGRHPELVPNEMFCTTAVGEIGLWVTPTAVERIAGRRCLVAERFDRGIEDDEAMRFHQETLAQALGFAPGAEPGSEEAEGPSFAEAAGLLRATGEEESIVALLVAAFSNYLLGNGDAHAENLCMLFSYEGPMLAPLHGVSSTAVYGDPLHTGLTVSADPSEPASREDLARIAEECAIELESCRNIAGNTVERLTAVLPKVVAEAKVEGWHEPVVDAIVQLTGERAAALSEEIRG